MPSDLPYSFFDAIRDPQSYMDQLNELGQKLENHLGTLNLLEERIVEQEALCRHWRRRNHIRYSECCALLNALKALSKVAVTEIKVVMDRMNHFENSCARSLEIVQERGCLMDITKRAEFIGNRLIVEN